MFKNDLNSLGRYLSWCAALLLIQILSTGSAEAAPATPTNPTPGTTSSPGPTQSSSTVFLDWSSSSGATYYELGVRDMSTNVLVVDTQVSSSSYTANLTAGRPYRWNVAACNSTGCSTYTTPLYFQTPPPVVVPATPTNPTPGSTSSPGPTLGSSTVTLAWSSSSGATYYDLGVRDLNTNVLVVDTQVSSTSYTVGLTAGRPYRWNVAACNSAGCSSFTALRYFQTPPPPVTVPATPTNPTPGSTSSPGPTLSSSTVTLAWSSSSGATYYDLGVRDLSTNVLVVDTQVSSTSYTVGLTADRPYRWNVAACNTAGCSSFTAPRYFETPPPIVTVPATPTNPTPGTTTSPGPTLGSSSVTLTWSSSSGATYYDLGVRNMNTNVLVVDTQVSGTSYAVTLNDGTPYRWNVAACNSAGCSSFTTPRYFQTPGTPDIRISPLSLTFDSPSAMGLELFSTPEEKAAGNSDQPSVTSTEVDVDLSQRARFGSSHGLVKGVVGLKLTDGAEEGVVESLPILAPISFSSLGVKWTTLPGDGSPEITVRYSVDGIEWSDWVDVTVDEHLTDLSSSLFFSNLMGVPEGAGSIQFAAHLTKAEGGASTLTSLTFVFINPGETPVQLLEKLLAAEPPALSRTQWGCPDGEDSPAWPPETTIVSHLIVHHTETTNSAVDWPAQVRSIWSYHTNTRGWGDIGYNYLIDPLGVIYAGRAGGDNVIGAHFACQNGGTQGIALLGSYSSTTPTTAALQSLETLLAWIASREGIDPLEISLHEGTQLNLDNISGHRDGNSSAHVCSTTACPGDSFYPLLPDIRANVDALLSSASSQSFTIYNDGTATLSVTSMQLQSAGSWIDWSPQAPFDVVPGGSRQVSVSVDFDTAPAGASTRRLLVSSDDPDESPYPGGVDIVVNTSTPAPCYSLSRTHLGSGTDPLASPANSSGCPSGEYLAGESIQVTASEAAGWAVGSWVGTTNDASTSTTNTVIMPAGNHTVRVNYVQLPPPCFSLTRTHAGLGADPVASPAKSDGCLSGRYHVGESIQVTADPAMGWIVGGWSGTVNDSSTSTTNTVTMPASNHSVSVTYVEEPAPMCYSLTLSHTGSGDDPTAWPASTGGCPTGQYTAGSLVQLTAHESLGWNVASWTGTDNDSSTSTTNTVTMPASHRTASANYVQADAIFQDGFESGDTSAWSATVQ